MTRALSLPLCGYTAQTEYVRTEIFCISTPKSLVLQLSQMQLGSLSQLLMFCAYSSLFSLLKLACAFFGLCECMCSFLSFLLRKLWKIFKTMLSSLEEGCQGSHKEEGLWPQVLMKKMLPCLSRTTCWLITLGSQCWWCAQRWGLHTGLAGFGQWTLTICKKLWEAAIRCLLKGMLG